MLRKRRRDKSPENPLLNTKLSVQAKSHVVSTLPQSTALAQTVEMELSEIYGAFTATTLVQQPLVEGIPLWKPGLYTAFKRLDECVNRIDWGFANDARDAACKFFSANPDFLSTAVNLWGTSWEVRNFGSYL